MMGIERQGRHLTSLHFMQYMPHLNTTYRRVGYDFGVRRLLSVFEATLQTIEKIFVCEFLLLVNVSLH